MVEVEGKKWHRSKRWREGFEGWSDLRVRGQKGIVRKGGGRCEGDGERPGAGQ